MARNFIPLDVSDAAFSQDVDLGASRYRLQFTWNTRGTFWTLDVLTTADEPIVMGVRLVTDWFLLQPYQDPRLPTGYLFCCDMTGAGADPGRDDLGDRVQLVYDDTLDD
jgi:hypothetical protein